MKLQEYFNMQCEFVIEHLTLNENTNGAIDEELYANLYSCILEKGEKGMHLLTYSNDLDSQNTEFYVLANELPIVDCTKITSDDVKLQISYNANNLICTLNIIDGKSNVKVPVIFDLADKQISYELSQLLKQKHLALYFISRSQDELFKNHSVYVYIHDKTKALIIEFLELFLNCYNLEDQKSFDNFQDLLIQSNTDYLKIVISRSDIENMKISKYENMLASLFPSVFITHNFCERVDFELQGYEDDRREIWQIPEIRKFIKALDKKFHQWLYFLDKNSQSMYWITMCLCGKGFGENEKFLMNSLQFNDFINDQLKHLNDICYYLNDMDKFKEIKESSFIYYGI